MTTTDAAAEALPPELRGLRDLVRRIAQECVAPWAAEIDATDAYPWEIRELLAEHDILAPPSPSNTAAPERES